MPDTEANFQREVLDRLKTIEVKIDNYDRIKDQVYKNKESIIELTKISESQDNIIKLTIDGYAERIRTLEDKNKWFFRTTVGSFITGLISIVVALVIAVF